MKKATLFLCLCMVHSFLFGQKLPDNAQLKWGNEMKFNMGMTLSEVAATDDSGYYLIKRKIRQELQESKKLPYLEKYDQNLRLLKSVDLSKLDLAGKPDFEHILQWNKQLWLFYTTDPGKGEQEGLYRVALDAQNLRLAGKSQFVMAAEDKKAKPGIGGLGINLRITSPKFHFYPTPDEDKLLIVRESGDVSKKQKGVNLLVMDQQFKPLWTRDETLQADSDELDLVNALLDSNGNAHLLSKSQLDNAAYKITSLFKPEKYFFTLISISENGNKALHKKINLEEYQINAANIQVNQDGHVYFGGFYTEEANADKSTGGTYFLKMDGNSQTVLHQKTEAFDATFLTRGLSEGKAKKTSKKLKKGKSVEDSYFFLDEIIIKSDGSVAFVGEDRYEWVSSSTGSSAGSGMTTTSTTFHYEYGSIVIAEFDPNGTRKWAKKIVKNQKSTGDEGFFFSYSVSMINNNLYFVFNDNVKNLGYNGKGKVARFTPKSYKEHMMSVATLDSNGNVSRSSLSMNSNRNLMTITPVNTQTGDFEMVVYGQYKKKYRLARLAFDPQMLAAD
ncbi:hypothetical protein [Cyclobacterium sp.]|uniref:hypothetical protein n=1 Tax=Cyclobacterium sp. TaxID=1966343 RepID=UPI0019C4DBCB|nr:hypothetical protein [Cyclobacterium sp.]MBD3629126.1 hypothetical protein [Cyclobacterium sp.]